MTEQVEVVYEGGVLRPLKPLPFAENQHLIVTVSSEIRGTTERGAAGQSEFLDSERATPALCRSSSVIPPASDRTRTREFEWLRAHGHAHAGKWVAVDGDRLVGEGNSLKSTLEQARAKGVRRPLVHHVPKEPSLPFAGW